MDKTKTTTKAKLYKQSQVIRDWILRFVIGLIFFSGSLVSGRCSKKPQPFTLLCLESIESLYTPLVQVRLA